MPGKGRGSVVPGKRWARVSIRNDALGFVQKPMPSLETGFVCPGADVCSMDAGLCYRVCESGCTKWIVAVHFAVVVTAYGRRQTISLPIWRGE